MKKKLAIVGIVGAVVLGGAVGVGAFAKEAEVSFDKANEIATQEVKGAHVEELELEHENGELVYEVELEGKYGNDKEIVLNANSGEVVRVDDDHDNDRNTSKTAGPFVKISKEQAIQIAKMDTPGKIEEIELDDDGYYEIEMKHEGKEIEFEISALDGTILEKEIDDDDLE